MSEEQAAEIRDALYALVEGVFDNLLQKSTKKLDFNNGTTDNVS